MHFSVIMPVNNVEECLQFSIRSVLNQSFHNFELICVDDGSQDSSGKILDDLAAGDARIKVYHRKNHGVGATRNFAMDHALGDYVTFLEFG